MADSQRPRGRLVFLATLGFFFVSGACGLLYQVVWTREFVLLFGATSYAVSTVLSVFFLGLGTGSLWGGRLADRTRRPLFVYGAFEVAVGLWAVLLVGLLARGELGVAAILSAAGASRAAGIAARGVLALVSLIVPVTLMGATLPLLAKFVTTDARVRGVRIGALYALNTLGAVAGCALTGFVLVAALGYTRATWLGAAGNVAIGLAAMALSRRTREGDCLAQRASLENADACGAGILPALRESRSPSDSEDAGKMPAPQEPADMPGGRGTTWLVVAGFAISGCCALALEVLWTRLLVLVFLGTTYAFTTMLTTLLCGIAAGSTVASAVVDRCRRQMLLFGVVEMLAGAACLGMLGVFAGLPARFAAMRLDVGFDWDRLVQVKFLLAFSVLFLPTFLFGMTFPIVVKAVTTGRERLGHDVGRLYSANTFGGVLGALAGGYVLIPALGTQRGIETLAWTLFAVGAVLTAASPGRGRAAKAVALVAGGGLMAFVLRQAPAEEVGQALTAGYVPSGQRVIHDREGVEATVAVSEPVEARAGSDRTLWINGVQATASIEKGVKMNRFQGVLPMLFDRDPRRVLFMCFGSGITAGTLGLWDFDGIDAVEISRDVLDAAPLFKADNFDVMHNPLLNFIVDDGRNFLLTTRNAYDVITFEPMPLALAGVSTFYTREYYELCRRRLAPGGLVSQWVPLHSLDEDVVRSLVYTFTQAFDDSCAWFVNADLFLIGSDQPLRIDYARASERLARPAIAAALHDVGLRDVAEVLTCFFMGKAHLDAYAAGGTLLTDDRPWAEFVAPKLIYQRTVDETLEELQPYYESPTTLLDMGGMAEVEAQVVREQLDRRARARANDLKALEQYYGGFMGDEPMRLFTDSLDIDPEDYTARYYLKEIAVQLARAELDGKEPDKALATLTEAVSRAPDQPELHLMLADLCFDRGDAAAAREQYQRYVDCGGTAARDYSE